MRWTLPLEAVEPGAVRRFGGKATALARLASRGLPVPPGFVVPTRALEAALEAAGLLRQAREALREADPDALAAVGERVRRLPLPAGLEAALAASAARLGASLAVRSSSVDEDGRRHAAAGQYASFLNVSPEGLPDAVRRCWASWFAPAAAAYRVRGVRPPPAAGMAVLVQRLVDARVSGVLFTVDPVRGSWREMLLEAVWGQAEALVSGRVPADLVVLHRPRVSPRGLRRVLGRLRVAAVDRRHVAQPRALHPAPGGGLAWEAVDDPDAPKPADAEAERLGRLGLRVEALFGAPVDVEWAIDPEGRPHLLQARPVTATGSTRGGDVLWTRRFFGERWTEPASPMGWSLVGPLLEWFIAYPETSRRHLGGAPATRLVRGWPYVNVTLFRHLAFKWPGMPAPRFMLEFLPPEELERWRAPFAVAPDAAVYASILGETLRERRWRRFRWNPLTNHDAWKAFLPAFEARLAEVAGEGPPDRRVRLGVELARDYLKIHVCSLLFANLFFQLAEAALPPDLRADLLRCPAETLTERTNQALFALAHGADLDAFLRVYGHRGAPSSWEIFSPRWAEEPERALALAEAWRAAGRADPAEVAAARTAATARAMAELARRVRGAEGRRVRWLVEQARRYLQLREDQRFHFDRLLWATKRALLELGVEVPGLDGPEGIRWLTWPEVEEARAGRLGRAEVAGRAERRRARHLAWAARPPPPVFLRGDDLADPEPALVRGRLEGLGISPGRVEGRARILRGPQDAHRLGRGEVLVATATDPGWTPLFLVAGALVLELGSVLSHGAVVAREYGLPGVVNVTGATRLLRDGQRVAVDGTRGRVWVLDD